MFAGSSNSGNDVCDKSYLIVPLRIPHISWPLLVRHRRFQSSELLRRLGQCELCAQQRQESCQNTEDRCSSWPWNLGCTLSLCQCLVFFVSLQSMRTYTWAAPNSRARLHNSAASGEEILDSGVTVASLFFRNVFGPQGQTALTVFIALRYEACS